MDVNEILLDTSSGHDRRVIKRYSNRKLYDTRQSRYVTLVNIADMVRAGEDVQIIDNATKEDKTEVTLALILSEELKAEPKSVPLGTLRELIQERSERLLSQLREGPIGRLIPGGEGKDAGQEVRVEADAAEEAEVAPVAKEKPQAERPEKGDAGKGLRFHDIVETSKATLDHWQHAVDERIRAMMPSFAAFYDLQSEVRKLTKKVEELENRLRSRGGRDERGGE